MKKLRIDLLSLLLVALLIAGGIIMWGEKVGIKTQQQQSLWLSALVVCTLVLAIIASFDRLGRWSDAMRTLGKWLHFRQPSLAGTTQARVISAQPKAQNATVGLDALRSELKQRFGWRWRYRLRWLLLTGNDKTIARLLPELVEHGHLITEDSVLLWRASNADGHPDEAWLKQLYRLHRRRPVDGTVLVINGVEDKFAPARGTSSPGLNLPRMAQLLHWSAPVYVLDVAQVDQVHPGTTPVAGCEFASTANATSIEADLLTLRDRLARDSVQQMADDPQDIWAAKLSERLDKRSAPLGAWINNLVGRRLAVRGVFFKPFPAGPARDGDAAPDLPPVWSHLVTLARGNRGRRVGLHPITVCSVVALTAVGLWTAGVLVSAIANASDVHRSQAIAGSLNTGDDAARLRSLLALQQRISLYETRLQHHTPSIRGFGLNRDRATLDALWTRYAGASRSLLTKPTQAALESTLGDLGKIRADALQDHDAQRRNYNRLKTYLMLADPERTDASFLGAQLADTWPATAGMARGEWQDYSQRIATFFANHLKAHPEWRIRPSETLVTTARATLVNQIGLANADDTVYQSIMEGVRGKYADISLPTLLNGTDAQGLFTATTTVPGVYTRAAWDGLVAETIDKAANERHVEGDWVLSGGAAPAAPREAAQPSALKQRLTARYFAEYTAAWQHMLNGMQWEPAANIGTAIDQLTRLTDAQTSPLTALMKSIQYQAQAGRPSQALGDTLVRRAKGMLGADEKAAGPVVNPLDGSFGPLLSLMGDSSVTAPNGTANAASGQPGATLSGVSLQSYLTAATTMRLKLQQIGGSPDAQGMARALAQAVFQGKLSDLTQVREQAALTAASLGAAWAGFGETLFMRPLDGAWQTILQPAAASINDAWRASIAVPFNSAFDGRYPFYESNADASFAELGRFVRPTSGLITHFLSTELAGALSQQGDQWVPNGLAPQTLAFDPAFLKAAQQVSALGAHLYANGDALYHFQIMPQPTQNVTRSELVIDKQQIVYFNQQETWSPVAWPGDGLNGHTALSWHTLNTGVRQAFDGTGDWAFLRLLAKADIKPLDSTRYELTWRQPDAESLHYVMRTQVGAGPLELLRLRGFKLPERIFVVGKSAAAATPAPLPPGQTPS